MSAQTPPSAPTGDKTSAAEPAPASGDLTTEAPWDTVKEFSALVTGGVVPGTSDESYIYRSKNLLRMEGADRHSYVIQDLGKTRDARVLSRMQCEKMKVPFVRSFPFLFSGPGYKYERVPVGKETVDGHPCQVEDVTVTFPPEKHHDPLKLKVYEAEDLKGFPVKIQLKLRAIEFRNVALGPQDPTLFIVPDQCGDDLDVGTGKGSGKAPAKPKKAPAGKSQ